MGDDIIGVNQNTNGSSDSLAPAQGYNYNFNFSDREDRMRSPFDPLLDLLNYDNIGQLFGSSGSTISENPFGGNPFQFNPVAGVNNPALGSGNSFNGGNSNSFGEI